jgi:SHS2 domain-containing protein
VPNRQSAPIGSRARGEDFVQHARDAARFVHEVAHTADVGFEVEAPTLEGVFERAALGLGRTIADADEIAARSRRTVTIRADDRAALLHDFLHALLLLAQVEGFLFEGVEVTAINEGCIRAEVAGEPLDPARHHLHGEVKAVTWHGLAVERRGDTWRARVILDV